MTLIKQKKRKQQGSVTKSIFSGVGLGIASFLMLLCTTAILITLTNIQLIYLKYILYIIMPFCVLITSVFNGFKCSHMKGIFVGIISGIIVTSILTTIILIVNRAKIDTNCIFIFPLSAVIGIPGGILGANLR